MAIGYSGIIPHEIIKNIIEEKLSGYQECIWLFSSNSF